jgi:molybdenum cofactor cytidylyltransferase
MTKSPSPNSLNVGIVLLAAGGSTRMGRPKQLLALAGQSLVRRAAEAAIESGCGPVVVMVGACAGEVRGEVAGLAVEVVLNEDWERGIGTSIRRGIAALMTKAERPGAAVIMLCDQPNVTAGVLGRLLTEYEKGDSAVVAAGYEETLGPPVVVSSELFPALLALPDDRGAKAIWLEHPEMVHRVECPEAGMDLDTPEDYARLLQDPSADKCQ